MKISILIQARMGSNRLPGKILMPLAGQPMISHVIRRCQAVQEGIHVAVVTTTETKDQPLVSYLQRANIDVFRGSENDVLDRYYQAATFFKSDLVVRITSDCPFLDPAVTRRVIESCGGNIDFSTNVLNRTYPRGLDTEVLPIRVLKQIWTEATLPPHREHVTKFIYDNAAQFRIASVKQDVDLSAHRWTVDENDDYQFAAEVYKALGSEKIFGMNDVVNVLEKNKSLLLMNQHIKQKI